MKPDEPNEPVKDSDPRLVVDICPRCGKESRSGSMTKWIFGGKTVGCSCRLEGTSIAASITKQDSLQGVKSSSSALKTTKQLAKPDKFVSNRYKIGELIGVGGMGAVYKAYDPELDKTFAVKILQSELAGDPLAVKRFEQEASAMCGLTHSNVVAVYDFGISKNGSPYIVMDYLDGLRLDSIVESETYLEPKRVAEMFVQVADAVEHAHKKRVIHRDLKPSNIIITTGDGGSENVKIVDFGIAKVMPEGDRTTLGLTQTGELVGSPYYMSPEQCTGAKIDSRSDIYSIGCVMYECLSGKPPFEEENPINIILHHLNDLPEELTKRFSSLKIPDDLNYIVMRCLEKQQSDRYQSAEELKTDLELFLAGQPIEKVKPKRPQTKTATINRLRVTSFVASTVASIAILGIVVTFGVKSIRPNILVKSGESSVQERWSKLDRDGQESFDHGEFENAQVFFDKALKLAEGEGGYSQLVVASLNELGDLARARKNFDQAKLLNFRITHAREGELAHTADISKHLDAALSGKIKDQADVEAIANSAIDQVAALTEAGNLKKASEILARATKLTRDKVGFDSEVMTRCIHNEAYIQHEKNNFTEAIAKYRQALELERKVLPSDHVHIATTLLWMVRAQLQSGEKDMDLLKKELNEALKISRHVNGPYSLRVALVRYHLAQLYWLTGDAERAKSEVETALTSLNNAREPDPQGLARCYALLAEITDDPENYKKALFQFESLIKKDYPLFVRTLLGYAKAIGNTEPKLAKSLLTRAYALTYHLPDKRNQLHQRALIEAQQGALNLLAGNNAEAEQSYLKALGNAKEASGDQSDLVAFVLLQMAKFYDDTNSVEQAKQYYKKTAAIIDKHKEDSAYVNTAHELNMRLQHFNIKPNR